MFAKLKISCAVILMAIFPMVFAQPEQSNKRESQEPDYGQVFPDGKINTLNIKMTQTDWGTIHNDMNSHYGQFGMRKAMEGKRPEPNSTPGNNAMPPRPAQGMGPGGRPAMPGGQNDIEPEYIPVSLDFNGTLMQTVGFRLKGNSSLSTSWAAGTYKLPFRLNFKKYNKQSLYSFQELSMSPAFQDNSLIREKVAYDLFREAGVPAPKTSFCKVYIDFGNGSQYCGLYTMVEVVDDTMIKSQFGEDKGNIYKPESTFSVFEKGDFEKKNNKKAGDWSDVEGAISALNAPNRKTEAPRWRQQLEGVFNMDGFIRWLAMNTLITSWDSYGSMPHNYYLYNATDKKLTWIPWDQNEAMSTGKSGMPAPPTSPDRPATSGLPPAGAGMGPGGPKNGIDLSLNSVGDQWPLIKVVSEDPIYFALYKKYVTAFSQTLFTPQRMDSILDQHARLIDQAVKSEKSPYTQLTNYRSFSKEIASLKAHVRNRSKAAENFRTAVYVH